MGRIYSIPWTGTITNAGGDVDLWEITPADDKPIYLRGYELGQISEVGDAAEEGLRITVIRLPATVTSGSGGSAGAPVPMDSADSAAGFASEINNTTVATTSGSAAILHELGWNIRAAPFQNWYPEARFCPKVKGAESIVIRCQTTVADDITFCGTAWVEEE